MPLWQQLKKDYYCNKIQYSVIPDAIALGLRYESRATLQSSVVIDECRRWKGQFSFWRLDKKQQQRHQQQ